MVEDADKSFLNDIIKEEEDSEEIQEDNNKQIKRDVQLEKEVAEVVDEILEEAHIETTKRPQQKKTQPVQQTESEEKPMEVSNVRMEKQPRVGPPSVPPPKPPVQTASIDDDNQFEANFEANFDDAFGESDSESDELEPHQLERLKTLKESDA